jgi:hypothetical protein
MAPTVRQHPEARPPGIEVLMAESSLARSAQESPELVECFRHEGEECLRCGGSGFRPRNYCAGCGEPAGSISQGTGAPLVKDQRTDGRFYHVRCLLRDGVLDAHWSCLERLGG